MHINFLMETFEKNKEKDAIVWKNKIYQYGWLLDRLRYWQEFLKAGNIQPGTVVIIEADFSPNSIALFLALMDMRCILVPLTSSVQAQKKEFIDIAQGEISFLIDENDNATVVNLPYKANHKLFENLRKANHPGLILFSSGSTGKSKAAVHDLTGLLDKFKVTRHCLRSITFLLYDHIGGVNTLLYVLSNAGTIITVPERTPDEVFRTIEKYKVEMLPTSPTFINLILLSEAYKRYDVSSLKIVTYGTEPMPESTLKRFHQIFPEVQMIQTYGLSEVGILRTKSKSSDSLWVKVGGEGFEIRVVEGILHIKAKSAMLGYLNAEAPFSADGWFITGDAVEVDGEYIKILGRKSEIINVGGEKVYPAEVESVVQLMDNVAEVTAYGEKNPITGNIVCVKVRLHREEAPKEFIKNLKLFCRDKLQNYKVPVKVTFDNASQHSGRFKKFRA